MKKFLQVLLLLGVVLGLAVSAGAEYYNEGHSGTASDPYVIDTNADLVALRDRVNAGTESADKYYRLTQNLDISEYTDWEPIGTSDNPFQGHFEGSNLSIHLPMESLALFGTIFGTQKDSNYAIRNLNVDGSIEANNKTAGGIVNYLNASSVENCSFEGIVKNASTVGGIAGVVRNGNIKNCKFKGSVEGYSSSGGIVGEMQHGNLGGISEKLTSGNSSIENCEVLFSSNILCNANTRKTYNGCAGGILGHAVGNVTATVRGCKFNGSVASVIDWTYSDDVWNHSADVLVYKSKTLLAGGVVGLIDCVNLEDNVISSEARVFCLDTSGGIAGAVSAIHSDVTVENNIVSYGARVHANDEAIGGIIGICKIYGGDRITIVKDNTSYADLSGSAICKGGIIGKFGGSAVTSSNNRYDNAEHGIGNNAQGVPSEEGCIKVGASISITTSSLPNAVAEEAYSVTLTTNSTSAVLWSLTNGTSLPEGLTLDRTTGTISGTPRNKGDYTFTVKASPESGAPATKEFSLTVQEKGADVTISITTSSLPAGTVGQSYSASLASNPSGANWTLASGTLPNGLTLSSSGTISGTPTASGTSAFTVRATYSGVSATRQLSITINSGSYPSTIVITTTSLPSGTAGQSYSASLASNPSGATWAVASGSLPNGLSLSSNGTISGTPSSAGTATFTVRATYGTASATQNLTITINAASLTITTNSLPSGQVGGAYSANLSASASGVTWSVYSGSLPNGLTLIESRGVISGTPTSAGTFSFSIQARNNYASTTKSFSIRISGSNNKSDDSNSSGGGCDSGLGIMSMMLLGVIAFRKSHK